MNLVSNSGGPCHNTAPVDIVMKVIVVLGMHRSGTSALTRIIGLCGATLPKTLMKPAGDNDSGFWESRPIMELHDEILASVGSAWDDPNTVPDEWFKSKECEEYKHKIIELLRNEYQSTSLIVFKDPRVCRLVPLWLDIFTDLRAEPYFVIMLRNPLEVAASLQRRNSFDYGKSLCLWLQHLILVEKDTRHENRLLFTYEQLLADWRSVIRDVNVRFDLALDAESETSVEQVDKFLRRDLRHFHETEKNLAHRPEIGAWVSQAYSWALELSRNHDAVDTRIITRIGLELEQAEKFFGPAYRETNRQLRESEQQGKILSERLNSTVYELQRAVTSARALETDHQALLHSTAWRLSWAGVEAVRRHGRSTLGKLIQGLYWLFTFQLAPRLKEAREIAIIRQSGVFDLDYYLERYPGIRYIFKDPIEHYVTAGAAEGRQPNAYFDSRFYLDTYPAVRESKMNPLTHYLERGAKEGLNPSAMFDTLYYLEQNPDVKKLGMNPLSHYLQTEKTERFETHPASEYDAYADPRGVAPSGQILRRLPNNDVASTAFFIAKEINATLTKSKVAGSWADELQQVDLSSAESPQVSVLIPFFDQCKVTLSCLKAISCQTGPSFEVILVDDGSRDDRAESFRQIPGIRYLRNDQNIGYLRSCNRAALEAKGEYIVLLNSDALPMREWLAELIHTFEIHPSTGLAGSMLLYPNGRLQEAGGLVFKDGVGWNYGRNKDPHAYQYNYVRPMDYCSGASIAIPRELWHELGGYDEEFVPAYYEDTDLALRVRQAGYSVMFNPFSRVIHFEGVTAGRDTTSGVKKYQEVNRKKFADRWKLDIGDKNPSEYIDAYVRRHHYKARLLWIDTTTPTPDQDSGSIDTVNFFKVALRGGWGVTFIPWENFRHEGSYTEFLQHLGVECLYYPYANPEKCLKELGGDCDVVVVSRATIAPYVQPLVKACAPHAKIIFNTVDLHFLRHERETELFGSPPMLQGTGCNPEVKRRDELKVIRESDMTIVISEQEAKIVRSYQPDSRLSVIPFFRDIPGRQKLCYERRDICFIGGFGHPPNSDAVKYFVSSIWPTVREELPGCRFVIVGSRITDEILRLASDSIIVRGFVPDLDDVFNEIRLSVAPLRYGAGIKGKIVSSLSYGVPVVATKIGVEGMDLVNGEQVYIDDTSEAFARHVVSLYCDENTWLRMSDNAIEFVRSNYSEERISEKITGLLEQTLVSRQKI